MSRPLASLHSTVRDVMPDEVDPNAVLELLDHVSLTHAARRVA